MVAYSSSFARRGILIEQTSLVVKFAQHTHGITFLDLAAALTLAASITGTTWLGHGFKRAAGEGGEGKAAFPAESKILGFIIPVEVSIEEEERGKRHRRS